MLLNLFNQPPKRPASLVPCLRDAVDKNKRHYLTTLYPGDQLLTTSKGLGFPKGYKLPVYGFCALYDNDGQLYQLRAYVRPLSTTQKGVVASSEREAVRFAFEYQREQWFGTRLMYLLEIDLLDHADCLKLVRLEERLGDLLLAPAATYRQAA